MPKPHNFDTFKPVLGQVDRMIHCDVGHTMRTVQYATRRDGPIHVHGEGRSIAKISLKESFIVEVCVITDDLNQFATRTSVNHGNRLNHSMWWKTIPRDAANPDLSDRFRPICNCSMRSFERDFPSAATSEAEHALISNSNWHCSPGASPSINDIDNPIICDSDDDMPPDLDTAKATIMSLRDENERLNKRADKFEASSKTRLLAARRAKQERDEMEKKLEKTKKEHDDTLQHVTVAQNLPEAGRVHDTNEEAVPTAARLQLELDTIQARYDDVREKYNDLAQKNSDLKDDFDFLKDGSKDAEKTFKKQVADLQMELINLREKHKDSHQCRQAADEQVENTNKKYDELKKKFDSVINQSASACTRQMKMFQAVQAERDALQTQLTEAKEKLDTAERNAAAAEVEAVAAKEKAAKTQRAIDKHVEAARRNTIPQAAKEAELSAQAAARDAVKKSAALEDIIRERDAKIASHEAALESTKADLQHARGFLDLMRRTLGDLRSDNDTTGQKRPAAEITGGVDTEEGAKRVSGGANVKAERRYANANIE